MKNQNKQHLILEKFLLTLIKGKSNSLIAISEGGLGKTELTLKVIKQIGMIEGQHYIYAPSYLTPKGLIMKLQEVNELEYPKLLILDDVEYSLKSLQIIGILRGALWEADGKRVVSWITSRESIEFDFNGKIVFLLNKLERKNPLINAFADRGLFYEMEFTGKEIVAIIKEKAKENYDGIGYHQRQKIADFIIKHGIKSNKLSLRILPKIYDIFSITPNHWQELSLKLLK